MRYRGHKVHWIALSKPKYAIPDIKVHNSLRIADKAFIKRNLLALYYFRCFKKKLKEISPDVAHSINVKWAGWFSVLSGFKNVIVTPQGGDVMTRQSANNDIIHNWLRKYTLLNAAAVTYGNDAMLKDINRWATPKKTVKYFAGVNFDIYNFKKSSVEIPHKLGIENRKIVFSPRMFEINSNLDTLIRTIPLVKKSFPDVVYLFACHLEINQYSNQMHELIRQLDVSENCIFLNEIHPHDMPNYYYISDTVVSILSSDAMPATILESMAMKKNLVLTKIPSYQDLMPGKYALMVKVKDKEETANAIIKSLIHNDDVKNMELTAYNWVRENANVRKLNDRLENLYFEIIKSSGGRKF